MISKIIDVAILLRAKLSGNELDLALLAATNDDNWQAAPVLLHAISSAAYTHEKWTRIHEFLWSRLSNTSRWKKVLKALNVIEFLLKNGPTFVVEDIRKEFAFFQIMENFQAVQDGVDRGASIRERARVIVGLLQNDALLEDERASAKLIRERMSHMAGTSSFSSEGGSQPTRPKYESYDSKQFKTSKDNQGFYNYGSGNYGDRQEDSHQRQQDTAKNRGGQQKRRARQIVPIVILDVKQRRVQENPLYQSFEKRSFGNKTQVSAPEISVASKKGKNSLKVEPRTEGSSKQPDKQPKPIEQVRQASSLKEEEKQIPQPSLPPTNSSKEPEFPNFEVLSFFDSHIPLVAPTPPPPAASATAETELFQLNLFANPIQADKSSEQPSTGIKKAASLQMEKIVWLSGKQKSLTDLSELELAARPSGEVAKKEFTNNIKIDPWAW